MASLCDDEGGSFLFIVVFVRAKSFFCRKNAAETLHLQAFVSFQTCSYYAAYVFQKNTSYSRPCARRFYGVLSALRSTLWYGWVCPRLRGDAHGWYDSKKTFWLQRENGLATVLGFVVRPLSRWESLVSTAVSWIQRQRFWNILHRNGNQWKTLARCYRQG